MAINEFFYKLLMLHYDGFEKNVWEEIGINKASASKECDIYQYWYFLSRVWVSIECLKWVSWCIDEVYKP